MGPDVTSSSLFKVQEGQKMLGVHPLRNQEAAGIDANQDQVLQDGEIRDYLIQRGDIPDLDKADVDVRQVVSDFKVHLRKEQPVQQSAYHSYEQVAEELEGLASRFPEVAERVSLGQTPEGREIWALHLSTGVRDGDTLSKPGVVITGAHHAREWASMEAPLYLAGQMAEGSTGDPEMRRRLEQGDIWIIPCANPDGYEHSRQEDNWWRKNRRPLPETGSSAVGVDLNRNYDDGKPEHATLYRPAGDLPGRTDDDFGRATSDNPRADTYRGPSGASESEIQALLKLELGRGNIQGILDHHGYGQMVLYPWGVTNKPVENLAEYRQVGEKMNKALNNSFRVMQSSSLYPTSGGSHDIHHANGIFSMTLEIGRSFQPDRTQLEAIRKSVAAANLVFIDEILARHASPPPAASGPADGYLLA
jgi:carboxypeptidase T